MRPDERDVDEEIRSHLAISVRERIERGEDPEAARLAALREFGYVPHAREAIRRVWYSRWYDMAEALAQDIKVGARSLMRAKGLAATVVITLALGIGANAAIFSVVRGVLLRPLVNRGEDRLIYIRQSAPGLGIANMTFSMAEYNDIKAPATSIGAFGDFSTIEFTMLGSGEPRLLHAGVVGGSYFDVMGLKPVLGRLLNASDDGRDAEGAVVLTHRFWTTFYNSDPSVIGKPLRLSSGVATIVGVLEPSIPYPVDTEIIANMVTSPHHLGATMNIERVHRMTELFGRLAPGASVEGARAELTAAHAAMVREHPESYPAEANMQLTVTPLRDQITAPARTILLVLLAAAAVVFVIACSNIANLILARSVRREGELAVRAALGASNGALRRTLLAESLVLCGAGAILGVVLAQPMVSIVARYAARFSVRALEVKVDDTLLWVGAGLAIAAAVLLAYVPRLPSSSGPTGFGLANSSLRITPGTNRRLRVFATTQIAFSFVLLAGAGMLVAALDRPADGEHRFPHPAGARLRHSAVVARVGPGQRTAHVGVRTESAGSEPAATCARLVSRSDATGRAIAWSRRRGRQLLRALARHRQVGTRPVHRRRLHAGQRRREPVREDAQRRAWLLRDARHLGRRRPRVQRGRSPRQRARHHRQPDGRPAALPERRRPQSQRDGARLAEPVGCHQARALSHCRDRR